MHDEARERRINAFVSSSDRSRAVLVLMISASILAFMAFWNSAQFSWLSARVAIAKVAAATAKSDEVIRLNGSNPTLLRRAQEYLTVRDWSPEHAKDHLDKLLQHQVEHVMVVRVPLIGATFDINDLSLFAGITFVVLLLWFRFAVMRELSNLRMALEWAQSVSPEELKEVYEVLAMRQVLTVPPLRNERREWFWSVVPRLLYALPLLVLGVIVVYDITSYSRGSSVSEFNTIRGYVLGTSCFVLVTILTVQSYFLTGATDRYWKDTASGLGIR